MGVYKRHDPGKHQVAYRKFRDGPQANPLTEPFSKIEIYSQTLADTAEIWELAEGDVIDPLPIHASTFWRSLCVGALVLVSAELIGRRLFYNLHMAVGLL
jgi:hypothetical protein